MVNPANQVNPVDNIPVPAAGLGHAQLIGRDMIRVRIGAELAELRERIAAAPANDPSVQAIAAWQNGFQRGLRHPDPQVVINMFIPELVNVFRAPPGDDGQETPFPADLFGDRPTLLIRYIVSKLRDRGSLLYSQQFDEEATRILAAVPVPVPVLVEIEQGGNDIVQNENGAVNNQNDDENNNEPEIPPELIEQLRQIEANIANIGRVEVLRADHIRAPLAARVNEQAAAVFQREIDRVEQQQNEAFQQIGVEGERIRLLDLEQRAIMVRAAEQFAQRAEIARQEAERLQQHLDVNGQRIGELEKATVQLQVDINNTRKEIEEKKSNWIMDVVCIVASVTLSVIFKKPIVIMPPK